jgi:hypothetical protein
MGLENLNPGGKKMARPARVEKAVRSNDIAALRRMGAAGARERLRKLITEQAGVALEQDRVRERREADERFRLEQSGELDSPPDIHN